VVVREHRTVLGAGTGEGKTTLALAMVAAIVDEGKFLEWQGRGGRALYIDAEQGLKTVKRRIREVGLEECEDADYLRVPDGLALDSNDDHVAAVEQVFAAGRYDVVVADPLYKLHRGDSNAEREAVDLMTRFDEWRVRYRFALIVPVHLRKPPPGTKFSINEFFGSSAYLRGAEVVIGLQRPRGGYARLHFLKDRDGDLPIGESWGLFFDRETGFHRDPDDGKPKETAIDKVRAALSGGERETLKGLVAATGYAESTIRDAVKQLEDELDDAVGLRGEKLYWLREEGE
jgi:AAA domain